jgi:nucleotide-binding universal stress UspA family protein
MRDASSRAEGNSADARRIMAAADNLVLVAINGSVADARAIDLAIVLAKRYHAEVTAIHVVEVPQELPLEAEMPAEVARGQAVLAAGEEVAQQYGRDLEVELLQARAAGPALVDEAIERRASLIVLGTVLRPRLGERSFGRMTVLYVMKNAPCEVVLVRLPPQDS